MIKKKSSKFAKVFQSLHRQWNVNPVTKVIPDKKKYRRTAKHKTIGD